MVRPLSSFRSNSPIPYTPSSPQYFPHPHSQQHPSIPIPSLLLSQHPSPTPYRCMSNHQQLSALCSPTASNSYPAIRSPLVPTSSRVVPLPKSQSQQQIQPLQTGAVLSRAGGEECEA